jgi:hypothetical protein
MTRTITTLPANDNADLRQLRRRNDVRDLRHLMLNLWGQCGGAAVFAASQVCGYDRSQVYRWLKGENRIPADALRSLGEELARARGKAA